jgi:hypothetical protein
MESKLQEMEAENSRSLKVALQKLAAKKADNDEDDSEDGVDEGDDTPTEPTDKKRKAAEKKRKEAEDGGGDDEAMVRFFAPQDAGASGEAARDAATARAIIRAGEKRRGGQGAKPPSWETNGAVATCRETIVPGAPLPPKGTVARAIIDAGKRRRGEEVED